MLETDSHIYRYKTAFFDNKRLEKYIFLFKNTLKPHSKMAKEEEKKKDGDGEDDDDDKPKEPEKGCCEKTGDCILATCRVSLSRFNF